jgi:hypothetical protein
MKKIVSLLAGLFLLSSISAQSVEAEIGDLYGGARITDCSTCSGGKAVGNVGGWPENGIVVIPVNVSVAGTYIMNIFYLSGEQRTVFVTPNDGNYFGVTCPNTGGWDVVGSVKVSLSLREGFNTIKLDNGSGNYGPDIDKIELTRVSLVDETPQSVELTSTPQSIEQIITGLIPNTWYSFEGDVTVAGMGQSARLGVKNYGGDEVFVLSSSVTPKKVKVQFLTGPSSTEAIIYFYKSSYGTAYGNNFQLNKIEQTVKYDTSIVFNPDNVSLIRNPGMGWAVYDDAADAVANAETYWRDQGANAEKYASVFYIRWRWSEMEPEEGKYAWLYNDNFKALVQGAKDRNLRLAFRVYVDAQDNWYQSTPDFVRQAGANGYNTTDGRNNWNPYLDDPIFQEKYSNFVKAFAAAFDDPNLVDFVDGYNFGWWGEGNSLRYQDWRNESQVTNWVFNLYGSSFKKVIPVITVNASIDKGSIISEGYLKNGYVPRRDGLGSKWVTWEEENILYNSFPSAMFVGESCYWGSNDYNGSTWKPWVDQDDWNYTSSSTWLDTYKKTYADAIKFHSNYLDLREVTETIGWTTGAPDLVQAFIVNGGYRFYPSTIAVSDTIKKADTIKIFHQWENMGVGVIPNNNHHWNNKYKVAFAILDALSGELKRIHIDTTANPSDWIKGSQNQYATVIANSNLEPGNYIIGAAIVNSESNNKPEIKLAVEDAAYIKGWLKVAVLTVLSNEILPPGLESFSADQKNCVTTIHWKSSPNANAVHYHLQASTDGGKTFSNVANIQAKGGNSTYTYTIPTQAAQTYYRLKIFNKQGTQTYSPIVLVKGAECVKTKPVVYPNPASDFITVNNLDKGAKTVQIVSSNGKVLISQNVGNSTTTINISNLASGTYYVRIIAKDGSTTNIAFIKAHCNIKN